MCVIELKTYVHPDGYTDTVERRISCADAVDDNLCPNITRRENQKIQLSELRPSPRATSSRSHRNIQITDSSCRSPRVYQPLSTPRPSSDSVNSNAGTRRTRTSTSSLLSTSTMASSPPIRESSSRRPRSSGMSGQLPPSPAPAFASDRTVRPDGTSVYTNPPSLRESRALENERRPTSSRSRVPSAMVDATDIPGLSGTTTRSRRSVTFDAEAGSPPPSRRPRSSLFGPSILRPDAVHDEEAVEVDPYVQIPERTPRPYAARRSGVDYPDRQSEEERQAAIERGRLARSDSNQLRRDRARAAEKEAAPVAAAAVAHEASREWHRARTEAALDGRLDREDEEYVQRLRDAEHAQHEQERRGAEHMRERERTESRNWRAAEAPWRYSSPRTSLPVRPSPGESFMSSPRSPVAPRSPLAPTSRVSPRHAGVPVVHNPSGATRRSSATIHERGDRVIERERTRAAHERMAAVIDEPDHDQAVADESDEEGSHERIRYVEQRWSRRGRRVGEERRSVGRIWR